MRKNLSKLVALSIAFGAGAGQAATLSEGRIKEILQSRSTKSVEIETLRSRDRQVLVGLANALSEKYGELMSGSEVVFTRIIEDGVVFYRMDFINLKNEARARALCEILEMDSCLTVDGQGEMHLIGTAHGRDVAALGRMKEPFAYTPQNWIQKNPQKAEIEARARELLDPLGVYPVKRPYLGPKLNIFPRPRPDLTTLSVVEYFDDDLPAGGPQPRPEVVDTSKDETKAPVTAPADASPEVAVAPAEPEVAPQAPSVELDAHVASDVEIPAPPAELDAPVEPGVAPQAPSVELDAHVASDVEIQAPPAELDAPVEPEVAPQAPSVEFDAHVVSDVEIPAPPAELEAPVEPEVAPQAPAVELDAPAPVAEEPVEVPVIEQAPEAVIQAPVEQPEPASQSTAAPSGPKDNPADKTLTAPPLRVGPSDSRDQSAAPREKAFIEVADAGIMMAFSNVVSPRKPQIAGASDPTVLSVPGVGRINLSEITVSEPMRVIGAQPRRAGNAKSAPRAVAEAKSVDPKEVTVVAAPAESTLSAPILRDITQTVEITQAQPVPRDITQAVTLTQAVPMPRDITQTVEITQSNRVQLAAFPAPRPASLRIYPILPLPTARHDALPAPIKVALDLPIPRDEVLTAPVQVALDLPIPRDEVLAAPVRIALDLPMPRDEVLAAPVRIALDLPAPRDEVLTAPAQLAHAFPVPRSTVIDNVLNAVDVSPVARIQAFASLSPTVEPVVEQGLSEMMIAAADIEAPVIEMQITALDKAAKASPSRVEYQKADTVISVDRSEELAELISSTEGLRLKSSTKSEVAFLGSVVFDDRYAQPSHIDFADGQDAGKLQKLPKQRPAVIKTVSEMSKEDRESRAMQARLALGISRGDLQPTDLAQVPPSLGAKTPVADPKLEDFQFKEPEPATSSSLEKLLNIESESKGIPKIARPAVLEAEADWQIEEDDTTAPLTARQMATLESDGEAKVVVSKPAAPAAPASAKQLTEHEKRMAALELLEQIASSRDTEASGATQKTSETDLAPQPLALPQKEASEAQATGRVHAYAAPQAQRTMLQEQTRQQANMKRAAAIRAAAQAPDLALADLRIELSYVAGREEVRKRVAEIKAFFPDMMLKQGRFYGASIPGTHDMYTVGIQAHDIEARDTLVWYLEKMSMPYAFRK